MVRAVRRRGSPSGWGFLPDRRRCDDQAMPDTQPGTRAAAEPDGAASGASRPRRRRRRVWLVVVGVLVLVLLAGGWVAWRGYQAADALTRAESVAQTLRGTLTGGNLTAVQEALPELRDATDRAVSATGDPLWRAAGVLPWLGDDIRAVTDVSRALDVLVDHVLEPLADGSLDPATLLPADGAFDVEHLRRTGPRVRAAAEQAARAEEIVLGVDPGTLVEPLARRVPDLQELLGEAADRLRSVAGVLEVLPGVVGGDGPRSYLVLVLNNAELRAAGGIVGSVAVIGADDGRLELTGYAAADDVEHWDEPVLPLEPGEQAVHSDRMARWVQNVTMTPHFPRSAELAARMWQLSRGQRVDAVVALDPVALSYLLEATGPVSVMDTELGPDDVVGTLLSGAYQRFPDPADSDEFFGAAASAVFGALTEGRAKPDALLSGLGRAADERRVSVWSSDAAEQQLVAGSALGGELFAEAGAGAVGVFLDDTTAGKMDYYLRSTVRVQDVTCTPEGAVATVELVLRSQAPADPTTLPDYVLGPLPGGLAAGSISTNVTLYAPRDGTLAAVRRGTSAIGGRQAVEAGRDVVVLGSVLAPGQEERYTVEVRFGAAVDRVEVWTTPTTTSGGRVTAPGCAADA